LNKFDRAAVLRIAVAILGLGLFGVLMWAFGAGEFFPESDVIWTLAWGKQMLADLYGGIILLSVIILLFERNWRRGLLWAAPLYVLGNVWGALWLAYRMPEIMRRLRSDPKT
jgi:hypothetical protein